MATLASLSTPPFLCRTCLPHSIPYLSLTRISYAMLRKNHFVSRWDRGGRRTLLFPFTCSSSPPTRDTEPESDSASSSTSPSSSSSSQSDMSYNLLAGLGGIGFLETSYLTYLKLTNSNAFCPTGGGNCNDILNSDYAQIFGTFFYITIFFFCH